MTFIIHIDYDEGDQNSYRAVEVRMGERSKRFASSPPDLMKDWDHMLFWFQTYFPTAIDEGRVSCSSTVTHFFMDGDQYAWFEGEL